MRAHETHERAGRQGGFPPRRTTARDYCLPMMLDVPVPRARLKPWTSLGVDSFEREPFLQYAQDVLDGLSKRRESDDGRFFGFD